MPVVVFLVILFCNLYLMGRSPLYRTEAHRAVTAHQMLRSGNWLVPHLYSRVYLRKPPMQYWVEAVSERLFGGERFGKNEWAWRLPSALGSAAMGAFLGWMALRWFGRPAGWVSGFACLALIALWSKNRSADIDSLNIAASIVCACAMIELQVGQPARPWRWMGVIGLTLGMTLLLKGPAGLPVVGGALIGPPWAVKSWRTWKSRPLWFGIAIGPVLFGAWVVLAYFSLRAVGGDADLSGVHEAAVQMTGRSLTPAHFVKVLTLPLILLLYALPVSAAPAVLLRPSVLERFDDRERRLIRSLIATVAAALAIGVLSQMTNPRYGYVSLAIFCPLAGAIAPAWRRGRLSESVQLRLRQLLTCTAFGYAVAAVVLCTIVWHASADGEYAGERARLAVIIAVTVLTAAWTIRQWLKQRVARGGWGIVLLCVVCSMAFNHFRDRQRYEKSAYHAGLEMRRIMGHRGEVIAGAALWDRPELFYYAGVERVGSLTGFLKHQPPVSSDTSLVLTADEYQILKLLKGQMKIHIAEVIALPMERGAYLARLTRSHPQSP